MGKKKKKTKRKKISGKNSSPRQTSIHISYLNSKLATKVMIKSKVLCR